MTLSSNSLSAIIDGADSYNTLVGYSDPITVAKSLAQNVQNNYYDLGCVLYNIKISNMYKSVDVRYNRENHAGWKEFCEEQLDGISYRTVQYWISLYKYFSDMRIPKERVLGIGWSKIKELTNFTQDAAELEEGLQIAETRTFYELKDWLEARKEGVEPSELKSTKFSFSLQGEPAKAVEEIMGKVKEETNGNANEAFFKVIIEWSMQNHTYDYSEPALHIET